MSIRLASTWPGDAAIEARLAYQRAREAGLSAARALVVGCIASFKDCWKFRKNLAKHCGISIRTVQRAITQAKGCGLIGVARGKKTEIPPNFSKPLPHGWSHRWTVGWGLGWKAAAEAVARTRLARLEKDALRRETKTPAPTPANVPPTLHEAIQGPRQQRAPRQYTAEEIDAELERLAKVKPPPD
jgi:hypothetical protein